MFRSINKKFAKCMYSVPKKKRKAAVGRTCIKGRFLSWNERVRG